MHLKELTLNEFDNFVKTMPISSYYQSSNYALFMAENGYEYDLIGLVDELGIIKSATLILIKKLSFTYKYGYAPKGFVIDYFDYDLLKTFTDLLKKHYEKKLVFLKINPEIAIGEIDIIKKIINYNQNIIIRDYLKEVGFTKLKDNLYFEALFPRYNAIINLNEYEFNNLTKNTKNKIRKGIKKGLVFKKGTRDDLDILYEFIKKKKNIDPFYYKNYYNVFDKKNMADLFLVEIDYEKYLLNSQELYNKELEKNEELNNNLMLNSNENKVKQKMNSDKNLLHYKQDIEKATTGFKNNKKVVIAGAFVIKYQNRIHIAISGINTHYKDFNANYYLHYMILEYYKNKYKFVDLNGITGDLNDSNPYKGLNEFKFGFKPHVYEFIGEFDYIYNERVYNNLNKRGILGQEFNKNKMKEI